MWLAEVVGIAEVVAMSMSALMTIIMAIFGGFKRHKQIAENKVWGTHSVLFFQMIYNHVSSVHPLHFVV